MALQGKRLSSRFKRWFTLDEATNILNVKCDGEEFTKNDLLQFSLDRHLNLSAIVHTCIYTYTCEMIPAPILIKNDKGLFLREYSIDRKEIQKQFSDTSEYNEYMFGYFDRLKNQCLEKNNKLRSIRCKENINYFNCHNFVQCQSSNIPFDFPLTDNNVLEIKNLMRRNDGLEEFYSDKIMDKQGLYLSHLHEFYPIIRPLKKLKGQEINDPNNYEVVNKLPQEVELVITKEELERFEKLLLEDSNENFTIEDYQNILFSLKELVCSKAKKWSQDEINNELDNTLKGMSKRRLETMWSMLNKKYK